MLRKKLGFTLMEIMVVIVVIAVLASVAGPMIGSITDQGRASATKSKLSALKSAMLAYQSDVGRIPYLGKNVRAGANYSQAELLSHISSKNVLVNDCTGTMKCSVRKYKSKWKGPYMESEPDDFMVDAWGTQIRYVAQEHLQNIYLWSAGPDLAFFGDTEEALNKVIAGDADGAGDDTPFDDIILSVLKLRAKLQSSNCWSCVEGEPPEGEGG